MEETPYTTTNGPFIAKGASFVVPIRLDIELEGYQLQETFTWISPEGKLGYFPILVCTVCF